MKSTSGKSKSVKCYVSYWIYECMYAELKVKIGNLKIEKILSQKNLSQKNLSQRKIN